MDGDIRFGIRVWREYANFGDGINVCFFQEVVGESYAVARLGPFEPLKPHQLIPSDAVQTIGPELAQQLMNGLWECGVRPAEGQGSTGQLAATRAHLDDMRALVFKGKAP